MCFRISHFLKLLFALTFAISAVYVSASDFKLTDNRSELSFLLATVSPHLVNEQYDLFSDAQNELLNQSEDMHVLISYGESLKNAPISLGIDIHTNWEIRKGKKLIKKGIGLTLLDHMFTTPGLFSIKLDTPLGLHDQESCNHGPVNQTLQLTVSGAKVSFLVENAVFSNVITSGMDLSQTYIEIPVEINFFNDSELGDLDLTDYHISGGTRLSLSFKQPEIIGSGIYKFRYYLVGQITHKGYYAITFTNHTNQYFTTSFEVFAN